MTNIHMPYRFWEIDAARGVAIVMMVLFHTLFDISFLGIYPVQVSTGFWRLFAAATATLFLFLVGLSFSISAAHAAKYLTRREFYLKFFKRGLFIFSLGIAATIVTWLYLGNGYIIFGILHLIGISIILAPLFYRFTWMNLIAGSGIVILGGFIQGIYGPIFLVWLGIHPISFYSVDYTPLIPWFGVVLIGIFAGKILYTDGQRTTPPKNNPRPHEKGLMFLGRHSLLIYLLHQPVIILILTALGS
jgi:uncharacterized membrane protein